jgi:hypothetical protein
MKKLIIFLKRSFRVSLIVSALLAIIYAVMWQIFGYLPYLDFFGSAGNEYLPFSSLISRTWWDLLFIFFYVSLIVLSLMLLGEFEKLYNRFYDSDRKKAWSYSDFPAYIIFLYWAFYVPFALVYLVFAINGKDPSQFGYQSLAYFVYGYLVCLVIFGIIIYFQKSRHILLKIISASMIPSIILGSIFLLSSVFSFILAFIFFYFFYFTGISLGVIIGFLLKQIFKLLKKTKPIFKVGAWKRIYKWLAVE